MLVDLFWQGVEVLGFGLGIIYQDEVFVSDGFGYCNYEEKIFVMENICFVIGFSSKVFISMGVGLLLDNNLFDWDEFVCIYFFDFQFYDEFVIKEMIVVDLLCYCLGLLWYDFMWYVIDFSCEEFYQCLCYLEFMVLFCIKWQY